MGISVGPLRASNTDIDTSKVAPRLSLSLSSRVCACSLKRHRSIADSFVLRTLTILRVVFGASVVCRAVCCAMSRFNECVV